MAVKERPTFGMHHVTVVPTNFESDESDERDDDE
jgi:hypothetical protein